VKTSLFPHKLSWLINNPLRRLLVAPEQLVERLNLQEASRVLEIGPGSGYFSLAIAREVPQGHLELVDVQPEMLEKTKQRLRAFGIDNVGFTTQDASLSLPFPDRSFDAAVLVAVLGEVADPKTCLKELHRVLRATGIVAVHEHIPDPDRIRLDRLTVLAETAGFVLRSRYGPSWNYTAVFSK